MTDEPDILRFPTRPPPIEEQFAALAEQWRAAGAGPDHPAYRRVIGLGPAVVPVLLAEVAGGAVEWAPALEAITGEQPAGAGAESDADREAVIAAWEDWGRRAMVAFLAGRADVFDVPRLVAEANRRLAAAQAEYEARLAEAEAGFRAVEEQWSRDFQARAVELAGRLDAVAYAALHKLPADSPEMAAHVRAWLADLRAAVDTIVAAARAGNT
jgi:hypothetical protein